MAGTRLFLQSLVLAQLLLLSIWSFKVGFCDTGDLLCTNKGLENWWAELTTTTPVQRKLQLPNVTATAPSLPLVQVNKFLQKQVGLDWKKNPNTIIICTQPESPVVQGQVLWWCPTMPEAPRTRVVVRKSSTVVFSSEKDLPTILKPDQLPLPFTLQVHLVLESSTENDVAQRAQRLSQELNGPISKLTDWPCVDSLTVQMHVVPPLTSRWVSPVEREQQQQHDDQTTMDGLPPNPSSILRSLTTSQANRLLATLKDPSDIIHDHHALYIYIPANPVENPPLTYQLEGKKALLTVGWDNKSNSNNNDAAMLPVHQWLAETMGLPMTWLDSDGSFPRWFEEWYWYTASSQLTSKVQQDFLKVQHLLQYPLEEEWEQTDSSLSFQEHFDHLRQLQQHLVATLTSSRLEPEFPLEHYAAIFAPLLFPLLLPFFIGLFKEYRRYKEKRTKSTNTNLAKI